MILNIGAFKLAKDLAMERYLEVWDHLLLILGWKVGDLRSSTAQASICAKGTRDVP